MKRLIHILILTFIFCEIYSQEVDKESIRIVRKNSFYIENQIFIPSINYDRIIPVSDKIGIAVKAGFFYFDEIILIEEIDIILGRSKHFFETGFLNFGTLNESYGIGGQIGYRFIGNKGLLLKAGMLVWGEPDEGEGSSFELALSPRIGFGYAF